MILSEIGKIAHSEWLKTFEMRPDMNLIRGEFVVMPNHFHAIIGIGKNQYNAQCDTHGHRRRNALRLLRWNRRISQKINSDPNPKIWHPLFADLKLG